MDKNYYYRVSKENEAYMKKSQDSQEQFFRQMLLVCSTILGILVSLHQIPSEVRYSRVVFLAAVALLAASILAVSIVLYDYSKMPIRIWKAYQDKIEEARTENRTVRPFLVKHLRRTLFFQRTACLLMALSLVSLVVYAFVS